MLKKLARSLHNGAATSLLQLGCIPMQLRWSDCCSNLRIQECSKHWWVNGFAVSHHYIRQIFVAFNSYGEQTLAIVER